jgi:hypothetical protein
MESCFGWFKDMLRLDFNIRKCDEVSEAVGRAVKHFNQSRPAYALHYKTPVQLYRTVENGQ